MRLAWRLFACSTILVTGCSVAPVTNQEPGGATPVPLPSEGAAFQGEVHGGPPQQPIAGAKVYLYAVTTGTTTGQGSTDLLTPGGPDVLGTAQPYYVKTDSTGHFKIATADYNCGSGGTPQQVYLYSNGGNPGLAPNTDNSAAGLMAVLGTCTNKSFSPAMPASVQLNEVTTVAAAYALAGFAASPAQISGVLSGTAQGKTGLANAVAMAGMLASIATGQALAPGINGPDIQKKINTLANSLAACVNTTDPSSTGCGTQLFPYTGNPSDTAQAAINVARSGGGSVSNSSSIFSASTAFKQFSPSLSIAPNDWTLAITWSNSLSGPQNVAIDASGNAYITENDQEVAKFTSAGAVASGSPFTGNGLTDASGLAIDNSGNVWVANFNCTGSPSCTSDLSEFTATGGVAGSSPFVSADGFNFNTAIAPSGNVWITNYSNNSISEFNSSGIFQLDTASVGSDSGSLDDPDGICIQGSSFSNDIWITNAHNVSGTSVARYDSAGTNYVGSPYTIGGQGPISCAIDSTGNVWTANYGGSFSAVSNSSIGRIDASGGNVTTYAVGGVNGTYGGAYNIAIDGAGNVWTANLGVDQPISPATYQGGSISELSNSGAAISPTNGFLYGLQKPDGIAIDGSGNVWVVNDGDGTVMELVGAATPVVTPIAAAVKNNQLGTAP